LGATNSSLVASWGQLYIALTSQLFWNILLEKSQVLVVGRPLQRGDRQVLVVIHRAPDELHLRARLAFVIQDLFLAARDVDQRLACVVLRHELALPRRDSEGENARARVGGGKSNPHGGRFAVHGQLDFLRSDDPSVVLDIE